MHKNHFSARENHSSAPKSRPSARRSKPNASFRQSTITQHFLPMPKSTYINPNDVAFGALLFGALHVQYQVPGMIVIVLIGIALGIVKERTSTTFTAVVHVFYDIGAFLLP